MEALNRQELEDLIIDLYYNQKKTFREIQRIVRKSPRDIRAVLNKVESERSSLSISSQAYRLFSELKTPTQIAIVLNIREPEATQLYREYWRLNQLYVLNQAYEETHGNLSSLIELYRQMKAAGLDVSHVIRLLKLANNDIQSIDRICQDLKTEQASLNAKNSIAAKTFQQLSDDISEEHKTLNQYRSSSREEGLDLAKLRIQKVNLEYMVKQFQNNNEDYLKIKNIVKEEVERILTNHRQLLKIAFLSVIDSCRSDAMKFSILYYNMPPITGAVASSVPPALSSQYNYGLSADEQYQYPNRNSAAEENDRNIAYEKTLLDESEKFYNKRVEALTQECIDHMTNNNLPCKLEEECVPNQSETEAKLIMTTTIG
jgi:hypothetical protein